jgi:hypothetical protein
LVTFSEFINSDTIQDARCRMQDARCRIHDAGCEMQKDTTRDLSFALFFSLPNERGLNPFTPTIGTDIPILSMVIIINHVLGVFKPFS